MAVGDVKGNIVSIGAGGNAVIQPPAGEEWMIVNISVSDAASLYWTDGTTDVYIDSSQGSQTWANYKWFITNTLYLKVVDDSGAGISMVYNGVQTK